MKTLETLKKIRSLVDPIPTSPYGWKKTSDQSKSRTIQAILSERDFILNLEMDTLIEGELYGLQDGTPMQVFDSLRVIKEVMMQHYFKLKQA